MNIYDIAKSEKKKQIFDKALEESCRQWCEFIEDAPERKDGEGFAEFFYEIFEEKEKELLEQVSDSKNHRKQKGKTVHRGQER